MRTRIGSLSWVVILAFILAVHAHVAAAAPVPQRTAQWTFMVYLNSDNDLDGWADWEIGDVGEMKRVGSSPDVNVVVLHDRKGVGAKLLYIEKGNVKIIQNLGKIDSGDYREVIKFVRWAHDSYPAEHYLLDIWDHGDGWEKRRATGRDRGISYDFDTGNNITTPQLGEIGRQVKEILGKKLDVFGMDACLMQMIEIAYELRGTADYIVASEEAEPADGWPYDRILRPLVANPKLTPRELSNIVVQTYDEEYLPKPTPLTMSAIDMAMLDPVVARIEAFARILTARINDDTVMRGLCDAASHMQMFWDDIADLADFCAQVNVYVKDEAINRASSELIDVLTDKDKGMIFANIHHTEYEAQAKGLSIHLPLQQFHIDYLNIAFGKLAWADFLKAFVDRLDSRFGRCAK